MDHHFIFNIHPVSPNYAMEGIVKIETSFEILKNRVSVYFKKVKT